MRSSSGSSSPITISIDVPERYKSTHIERTSPGIIGTKRGTFILDPNLNVGTISVPVEHYDEYLKKSIDYGLEWLNRYVFTNNIDKQLTLNKFKKGINYTDECNQQLIDICYGWVKKKKSPSVSPKPKTKSNFREYSVWAQPKPLRYSNLIEETDEEIKNELNEILSEPELHSYTIHDINLSNGYLVCGPNGESEIFINIRHNDHNDILPMSYLCEKFPELKNILHGTYKLIK